MSLNGYLMQTVGLSCPVEDSSFAIFNLFLRKHKQRNPDLYLDPEGEAAHFTQHGTATISITNSQAPPLHHGAQTPPLGNHVSNSHTVLGTTGSISPPSMGTTANSGIGGVSPTQLMVTQEPTIPARPLEPATAALTTDTETTPEAAAAAATATAMRNATPTTSNGNGPPPAAAPVSSSPQTTTVSASPARVVPTSTEVAKDPQMLSSVKSNASVHSIPGEPIETLFAAMIPFVQSLCEMEETPLNANAARKSRERLLQTYAAGLGPNAGKLLEGVKSLNSLLKEILVPAIPTLPPPSRQGKVQLQSQMHALLQRMRGAKEVFEEALNDVNCLGDEEEGETEREEEEEESLTTVKEQLYGLCDRLYNGCVLPRCAVAEILLSVKVALAIRTEEVLLYAQRGVESMFDWNFGLEGFTQGTVDALVQSNGGDDADASNSVALPSHRHGLLDVSEGSLQMMVAAIGLAGCFAFRASGPRQPLSAYRTAATTASEYPLREQCLVLTNKCRLPNAEGWIKEAVDPKFEVGFVTEEEEQQQAHDVSSIFKAPELGRSKFGSKSALLASINTPTHQSHSTPTRALSSLGPTGSGSFSGFDASSPRNKSANATPPQAPVTSSSNIEELFGSLVHHSDLVAHGSAESQSGANSSQSGGGSSLGQTAMRQNTSDLNYLIDVIGSVNIWLRRNGLYKDALANTSSSGPKTSAPGVESSTGGGGATSNTLFLDHDCNDLIGWTSERSATYSEACLRAQLAREQMAVCQRLLELATETENEDFFRVCHDEDNLSGLLSDADNCCVMNECRRIVERRVATLMVVKVKVFHHSGEVRAVTLPQKYKLKEMLEELQVHFLDAKECRITHTDEDGDKVSLSTNQEWQDLVRLKRISHMVEGLTSTGGGGLNRSTSNLQASTVGASSVGAGSGGAVANTMKLELYFDRPPPQRLQRQSSLLNKPKLTYVGNPGSKPAVSTPKNNSSSEPGTPDRPPAHLRPAGGSSSSLLLEGSYGSTPPSYQPQIPSSPAGSPKEVVQGAGRLGTPSGPPTPSKGGRMGGPTSLKDLQTRFPGAGVQQRQAQPLPPASGSPTRPGGGAPPDQFSTALQQMERQAQRHLGEAPPAVVSKPAIPVHYNAPPPPGPAPGVAAGGPEQVVVYVNGRDAQPQPTPGGYRPTAHAQAPPSPPSQPRFQFQSTPQVGPGGAKPGQWGRPVGGHGGGGGGAVGAGSSVLDFAKHSMSTVALSSDEDEDDQKPPNWNRGTEDHISAVLNSGDAQAHLKMLRHNGPYRRGGRKA